MKTIFVRAISSDAVYHQINCTRLLAMAMMAIGVCFATISLAFAQEADPPELPKSIAKKLKKNVIPPLLAGNHGAFQSQLAAIVSKLKPESFEQIEIFGQRHNIGSLNRAFYTAWRNDVRGGDVPADMKMRRPIARVATFSLTSNRW